MSRNIGKCVPCFSLHFHSIFYLLIRFVLMVHLVSDFSVISHILENCVHTPIWKPYFLHQTFHFWEMLIGIIQIRASSSCVNEDWLRATASVSVMSRTSFISYNIVDTQQLELYAEMVFDSIKLPFSLFFFFVTEREKKNNLETRRLHTEKEMIPLPTIMYRHFEKLYTLCCGW